MRRVRLVSILPVAIFAPVAVLAAACASTAGSGGTPGMPETARLDSVYAVFTRAYAEADVDLLMDSVYAADGFYLPPNSPILRGQENFRGQFEGFLGPMAERGEPGPRISFDIVDRTISGDLAYDIGVYTLRPADAPEDAEGGQGKFIVIWKRGADGQWRIHADGYSALGR